MAYGFYGGRKGTGLNIVGSISSGSNVNNNNSNALQPDAETLCTQEAWLALAYGDYVIVDQCFLYRRVMAETPAQECLFLGTISGGAVSVNAYYYPINWISRYDDEDQIDTNDTPEYDFKPIENFV